MLSAPRGLVPREGLESLLVKMGRTGPLAEPCRGPQVGKSGDPHSQNADSTLAPAPWSQKATSKYVIHSLLVSLPGRVVS